jgi:hypothetical protein
LTAAASVVVLVLQNVLPTASWKMAAFTKSTKLIASNVVLAQALALLAHQNRLNFILGSD